MRTAAYCRFSSDAQREASIRDQLRNIETYCDRLGWPTPALYQDQAISGSRNDRPGYLTMLAASEVGAFDVLLVDDLSRLSRDHIESATTIRRLKYAGVRVIGVSDGTDTARDGYKLETWLRGLMSEMYLDDLAKKTHRGLMGQALDGYSAGGLPYGYRSLFDGTGHKRVIDEEQATWVRHVFERYANGHGPRAIAHELNTLGVKSPRGGTWVHTAIYPDNKGVGMLGNAIYNGRQVWNKTAWVKDPMTGKRRRTMRPMTEWVIVDAPELKIIDDDLWERCQGRAKSVRTTSAGKAQSAGKGPGGPGPKYLFSGLLKCGCCGHPFIMVDRAKYGCSANRDRGESVCDNKYRVKRSTIESVLLADIKSVMLSDEAYRAFEREVTTLMKSARPDPSAARRKVVSAQKEVDNLMSAIRAGIVTPTTRQALIDAEQGLTDAQSELRQIEAFAPAQMLPRAREIYRDMVSKLECVDDIASAREALRSLIGDVRLIPENDSLTAEIQNAGLAGVCKLTVVAGAGFDRYPQPSEQRIIRIEGLK